ncbi:MAG: alpha-hydroxy acid oxidase [Myxococcota bacterium]
MDARVVASRRSLLRFALASPLWLAANPVDALEFLVTGLADAGTGDDPRAFIERAREAQNVFDFEPVARQNLLPPHWTFLSQGVHDEFTLRANREAFGGVKLLPRRLVDVRDLSLSTEVLGESLSAPIVLAPCGSQRAFHPDAELAVARAAKRRDHLQILSTGSSTELVDVAAARGAPLWFQLYTSRFWPFTRWQLREAEEAGCSAVVVTVDTFAGLQGNRDRIRAFRRPDNPSCQGCHEGVARFQRGLRETLRFGDAVGLDLGDAFLDRSLLDWEYVDRIRDGTSMKVLLKGITSPEDARLCVEHGMDGLIVSNHGGRAEDSGLATIEALPAVVAAVDGRIPVLVDSGFRRGPDVYKALALGASAVCVGRPYLWGLAAFGQEGVEAVLRILREELSTIMRQMGTPKIADVTRASVRLPGEPL